MRLECFTEAIGIALCAEFGGQIVPVRRTSYRKYIVCDRTRNYTNFAHLSADYRPIFVQFSTIYEVEKPILGSRDWRPRIPGFRD